MDGVQSKQELHILYFWGANRTSWKHTLQTAGYMYKKHEHQLDWVGGAGPSCYFRGGTASSPLIYFFFIVKFTTLSILVLWMNI